jgi:hypothetical protein
VSDSFIAQMALVVLAPGLLAFVFGYFAFRSRIKGVYFSIITQAMTYAAMLLFFRNETGFGGNNGFTDFKRILGYPITAPQTKAALYWLTLLVLVGVVVGCRMMMATKFGRALQAIRDGIALYSVASQTFRRLTDHGSDPVWLSDSRRLLFHHGGKIHLLDSQSGGSRELLSIMPEEVARRGFAVSPDDRHIYFSVSTTEADVWMLEIEH